MPRWPPGLHPFAQSGPGGPGSQAVRRVTPTTIFDYKRKITGVPLQPGQAQTIVSGTGGGQVTLGPVGVGTVWYPAQATISTTTGPLDTSTFNLYLGPAGVPITLVGTLFPGGAGTIALAIPPMSPGQYLIGIWTGGHAGDLASLNVIGVMDAVTT